MWPHNLLGNMYAQGEGVIQSDRLAFKFYKLAAEAGDAAAQFNLGVVYADGEGVNQSDRLAFKFFKLSAEAGYAAALTLFDDQKEWNELNEIGMRYRKAMLVSI